MHIRLLAFAAVLAFATGADAQLHEFSQAGTLKIDAGAARSATLHAACSPAGDGGALSIDLIVLEANTRKDFDYDDFEGPDAPAGAKALSHIAWTTAAGSTEITHTATGWYAPDPPQSFMFGVTQMSHHRGDAARLVNAIRVDPGQLVWTQTGLDNGRRQLVARFDLDAAAVKRLHDAASSCLPQNMPTNPR